MRSQAMYLSKKKISIKKYIYFLNEEFFLNWDTPIYFQNKSRYMCSSDVILSNVYNQQLCTHAGYIINNFINIIIFQRSPQISKYGGKDLTQNEPSAKKKTNIHFNSKMLNTIPEVHSHFTAIAFFRHCHR